MGSATLHSVVSHVGGIVILAHYLADDVAIRQIMSTAAVALHDPGARRLFMIEKEARAGALTRDRG